MTIKYIAELCQNHLGKIDNIEKMVEECAFYGAKIIKLQYILTKNLAHRPIFDCGLNHKNKKIIIKRPYKDEYKRLKKLELKDDEIKKFIKICEKNNVEPAITCFARENIQILKDLGFKTIKVASYDCGSFQLIREISNKFKNLIISTGATYDDEIDKTFKILKKKKINFSFLHCVTIYPTPFKELHLNRIQYLRKYTKNIGYSDHSSAIDESKNLASMASIYFGAKIIERRIRILSKDDSRDGPVSIEPKEIGEIIRFSKFSKQDQKKQLLEMGLNFNLIKGKKVRPLNSEELLNREYYRGRFVSFSKNDKRQIFNWDEADL